MGTHPHTLQELEEYNGGYIYYSLANWTFGGHTNPRDKDSVIAKVTVMRDVDGEISVVGVENIPCSVSGSTTVNDYRPVPYEAGSEEYIRTLSKLDGSFTGPDLVVSYDQSPPDETTVHPAGDQPDVSDDAESGSNTSDGDNTESAVGTAGEPDTDVINNSDTVRNSDTASESDTAGNGGTNDVDAQG